MPQENLPQELKQNSFESIGRPASQSLAVQQAQAAPSALAQTDQARAMTEVQAALAIAQARPRNELHARDRLVQSCARPGLAQAAVYEFPRGGQSVSGPSIRLAEVAARCWGNMNYGFRELNRESGKSEVEAFAWDLETNCKAVRQFAVPHSMETRNGLKKLTSERDIYEFIANHAQRRVRACILEIIPGDIIEEACAACDETMKAAVAEQGKDLKAVGKEMVKAFGKHNVTREHIEERLGHRLEAITAGEILRLRKIYKSIEDGFSEPHEWFPVEDPNKPNPGADLTAKVRGESA